MSRLPESVPTMSRSPLELSMLAARLHACARPAAESDAESVPGPDAEPSPGPTPQSPPAPDAAPAMNEEHGSATAVAAPPAPDKTDPKVDQLPPFKVLLHNDDVNTFADVFHALVELTPLNKERAVEVLLEAHTRGVALVLVTHKERAELYREQLQSKGLTATIEAA